MPSAGIGIESPERGGGSSGGEVGPIEVEADIGGAAKTGVGNNEAMPEGIVKIEVGDGSSCIFEPYGGIGGEKAETATEGIIAPGQQLPHAAGIGKLRLEINHSAARGVACWEIVHWDIGGRGGIAPQAAARCAETVGTIGDATVGRGMTDETAAVVCVTCERIPRPQAGRWDKRG